MAAEKSGTAIAASCLGKSFGTRKALDGATFELPKGAFLSIFGANGAGKSTLLGLLATLLRPSAGEVEVMGFSLKERPDEVRARIGLISHKPMLYMDLSAEENLLIVAHLYGIDEPKRRASELLAAVGLAARRHDVVRGFSRGMVQRLSIARALVHDPELLFLDEPYSGLDPHAIEVLDAIIARMRGETSAQQKSEAPSQQKNEASSQQKGEASAQQKSEAPLQPKNAVPSQPKSFCMVSHDLAKGMQMATHLMLLERGKIVLYGSKDEIAADEFRAKYFASTGMATA
jgi:heme exporter protein A